MKTSISALSRVFLIVLFAIICIPNAGSQLALREVRVPSGEIVGSAVDRDKKTDYGRLPLHFEPNSGQSADGVKYLSRGNGYGVFLDEGGATLVLTDERERNEGSSKRSASAIRMNLLGANSADGSGESELESRSNYFIGNDPENWRTNIPNYEKVRFKGVYDRIDVVYYGNQRRLEYDFVVAPEADPSSIKLGFDGTRSVSVDPDSGDLLLETDLGTVRQHKPIAFQQIDGERIDIVSAYLKTEEGVGIRLGDYDRTRELVIDPILAYSSYLGGSSTDLGTDIAVDSEGNAFVTGYTISVDFQVTPGALKTQLLPIGSTVYGVDAFVSKIDPAGTGFVYSTYLGTNAGSDYGYGITVDGAGNAFVVGNTDHASFPIVAADQPTFGGNGDGFIAKLNPSGSALLFSTFVGGSGSDSAYRLRMSGDDLFVVGQTLSGNFPTTAGVLKPAPCSGAGCPTIATDAFLSRYSPTGTKIWSTLFGGSSSDFAFDIAVDSAQNSYAVGYTLSTDLPVTAGAFQAANSGGQDGFAAKVNSSGTALEYATYLGGGLQSDRIWSVDVDDAGNAYLAGQTENSGFPTTAGAFDTTWNNSADAFVTKLNPAGTALVYSTFLGGGGSDKAFAIRVVNGEAIVGGETLSANLNFPLRNSLQGNLGSMFLTRLNVDGSDIKYSSLLGTGGVRSIAVDSAGNAYLTGEGHYLPTTAGAFRSVRTGNSTVPDGFVMKIAPTDEGVPVYAISGTVNDTTPFGQITVTISGTVNRSVVLSGSRQYSFGGLPAGGNYTVSAHKVGYSMLPENAVFNNLGANQFADFTVQANNPPEGVITSPAFGTTYNSPASVTIQATASDPDGDAITQVEFIAYSSATGNVPLAVDTTAPYEFTWENVPIGTWALYAIPTDSLGLRGGSTPIVHVFVVDGAAPAVSITSPTEGQNFAEGDNVPLAADVSSSVTILEFYDQNNTLIGRRTASPWTTQWRVMTPGNYTITAKGFTSQGQSATSAPVGIVVNPINHRISGRIVDSITGAGIEGVTLNLTSPSNPNITAQRVSDADGAYLFTGLGTTPNDSVVITPSGAGLTFQPATRGIGFLGYIEWPNQNFTATRETQITVAMTSPANGEIYTAPAAIDLAADASSSAGAISRVEFYRQFGSNVLLGTDDTAPYSLPLTDVPAGNFTYFARAYDSTGAATDSVPVSVSVAAAPTTVRIVGTIENPGGGWMPGITVRLAGTANGSPVTQTSVTNSFGTFAFYNLPIGGDYTVTPQAIGTMTFTPESQTFTNLTVNNDDVQFLSSAPNQAPTVVINSPADGSTFNIPGTIPISATAADSDGTVTHFRITAVGNNRSTTVGESNNGILNLNWSPTAPGPYTLWATATDNGGFQTSTSVEITVTNNTPITISGRIVDRNSTGIEGVALELKNFPETSVVATATTDAAGNFLIENVPSFGNYVLRASKLNYTFAPQKWTLINVSANETGADFTGTLQLARSEFDGDGASDLAVWRPSNGVWYVERSTDGSATSIQFGGAAFGDVVVPGNFDGDLKTDYAVYRHGVWYIRQSSNGQVRVTNFGISGDKPVSGDFDGDGKTDLAVWRPTDGVWHVLRSSDGGYESRQFGLNGDVPLAGDFDADGKSDITIWRPSTGVWHILRSSDGGYFSTQFGRDGDVPLIGDFDGDKLADQAVYRPSSGEWFATLSATNGFMIRQWGIATDIPVPGDYDRDGKTDLGVFRPSEGNWYVRRSSDDSYFVTHFGLEGDIPVPSAY